jgi:hypothetical protein
MLVLLLWHIEVLHAQSWVTAMDMPVVALQVMWRAVERIIPDIRERCEVTLVPFFETVQHAHPSKQMFASTRECTARLWSPRQSNACIVKQHVCLLSA